MRRISGMQTLAGAVAIAMALGTVFLLAQAPSNGKHGARLPRTADGRPDLQGTWDFRVLTPLERPADLAGKDVLTAEEAADLEERTAKTRVDRAPRQGDPGTYNQFWFDFGTKVVDSRRTSLITDPPDGRLPPLTPKGAERAAAFTEMLRRPAVGPEDRPLWERCILGFNAGPPIIPNGYNNNLQIFQTRDYVTILTEMVHDARIIPVDGRAPAGPQQWKGTSSGRWEGDTFVIASTNFRPQGTGTIGLRPTFDEHLRLTERFSLVASDTLLYEFTVDDPTIWTKPWTASVPMKRNPEKMYEYACHEGNYGMTGILAGARANEQAGTAAVK
jgi:hypothetical protein